MDIPAIKAFIAISEHESFSLAADQLYLTQPAISKRINTLEQQLGVRLFDRINRRVLLTQAGKTFLTGARKIIAEVENTRDALAHLDHRVAGKLSLATSHHIGLHRLPPVLKQYVSEFPDVDLNLAFMKSEDACHAVSTSRIELAVVTLPNKPIDNLATMKLWPDPLSLVVNNGHPLLREKPDNSTDMFNRLSAYPAILPEKVTYTRQLIDQYVKRLGLDIQVKFSNDFLETIKMMVSVGLGWSILPETLVDNTLATLELPDFVICRELGLVYHKERTLSLPARKFLQQLSNAQDVK